MSSFYNVFQKYQLQVWNGGLKRFIRDQLFVYERIRIRVSRIKKEYKYTVIKDSFFVNQSNINFIGNQIELLECEISLTEIILEDLNREFHRSYNSPLIVLFYPNYCDLIPIQIHRASCAIFEEKTGINKVMLQSMKKIECQNFAELKLILKKVLKSQNVVDDNCHIAGCMTCYSYVSSAYLDLNEARKEVKKLLIELRSELINKKNNLFKYNFEKLGLSNILISRFCKENSGELYESLNIVVVSKIKKQCHALHWGIQKKRVVDFDKSMSERDKKSLKFCLYFHVDGNIFIGGGRNLFINGACCYHVESWVLVDYQGDCVYEDEMTTEEISWATGEIIVRFDDVVKTINPDGLMIIK